MTTVARILYYSDIHIEIRGKEEPSAWTAMRPLAFGPDLAGLAGTADLLVLAGDIGRMRSRRDVSTLHYAEQAAAYLGCPALVVPGNHEYYRGVFEDERDALLAAQAAGVTVLDRARRATLADLLRCGFSALRCGPTTRYWVIPGKACAKPSGRSRTTG